MALRRLVTTLAAAAVLAAAGACSKQPAGDGAAGGKQGVGAKIDRALDNTQEKLGKAGERAKDEIGEAAQKTQEALSRAGEQISATTSNAVNEAKHSLKGAGSPPYSPRQPVNDAPAAAPATTPPAVTAPAPQPAAPQSAATSTTATQSSGPTASLKSLGLSQDARNKLGDAAIIVSIEARLIEDPGLSVLKIEVDANDGVVTL
ncbi:MAG TPA: hypothetical protein VFP44_18145, partial [Usitatibacter sp.]|nr:hypothetical protein [Usitatibacter sp.]